MGDRDHQENFETYIKTISHEDQIPGAIADAEADEDGGLIVVLTYDLKILVKNHPYYNPSITVKIEGFPPAPPL